MALFDFFKKNNKPASQPPAQPTEAEDLMALTEVTPGMSLPKALALHWKEIEKTKLTYIAIEAEESDAVAVRQSGFGSHPCLPKGYPYPVDEEGRFMFPLAQINFAELPVMPGFPQFGYLQFYIAGNDLYGLEFSDRQAQTGFRILYFEESEVKDCETDFSFLEGAFEEDTLPFSKRHRLSFSIKEDYFGTADLRGQKLLDVYALTDRYPAISRELESYIWSHFSSNGHKMGGYAFFTQDDPRSEEQKDYILLLQIDSDGDICWGDAGVANFFIHPDDLLKKDFSKVMYNWDCS